MCMDVEAIDEDFSCMCRDAICTWVTSCISCCWVKDLLHICITKEDYVIYKQKM